MSNLKHIQSILLLPGIIAVAIPATILYFTGIVWPPSPWNVAIGTVFMILGIALMVWTNRLFATVGHGTLAPWNPPQKLVVRGVYQHVRNPMITGAVCILLGEVIFFGSWWLLGWFGFALVLNLIYIPLSEEPGLVKRFGEDRIMDELVKALEHRGYSVSVDQKEGKTWATVNEEKIQFSLAELTDRREKELTAAQKREREEYTKYSWITYPKEYVRFPNGQFTLEIDNYSGSLRRRWSDSSSWRVEDVLNRFMASLIRIAEDMKRSRLEAKERARIWKEQAPERERLKKEEEQRRLDEERRQRQEKCRAKWLESKLPYWRHAQEIRAFIASVRAEAIRRQGEILEGTDIAKWLAWADQYAIQIDPLAEGNQLPVHTLDEDTLRKLEWGINLGGETSNSPWSPPGRPR